MKNTFIHRVLNECVLREEIREQRNDNNDRYVLNFSVAKEEAKITASRSKASFPSFPVLAEMFLWHSKLVFVAF